MAKQKINYAKAIRSLILAWVLSALLFTAYGMATGGIIAWLTFPIKFFQLLLQPTGTINYMLLRYSITALISWLLYTRENK